LIYVELPAENGFTDYVHEKFYLEKSIIQPEDDISSQSLATIFIAHCSQAMKTAYPEGFSAFMDTGM
jgi:hypothetical protein